MWGKKGKLHADPDDPPRRRGLRYHGHGTWDHDRPPVVGVVGRESHGLRLAVTPRSTKDDLLPVVLGATLAGARLHSDEWLGYEGLETHARRHVTVTHRPPRPEWARDDDGDGVREVHCNTIEGIWTGVRNFLRTFRGVNKVYLAQYLAIFSWGFDLKVATDAFIRMLLTANAHTAGGT